MNALSSSFRKLEGVAIIAGACLCAVAITAFPRPTALPRIPARAMEIIRYMLNTAEEKAPGISVPAALLVVPGMDAS